MSANAGIVLVIVFASVIACISSRGGFCRDERLLDFVVVFILTAVGAWALIQVGTGIVRFICRVEW